MGNVMKRIDLVGRIKRTYKCQIGNLYKWILDLIPSAYFYKHPKLVTGLWYASQKGRFPNLRSPKEIDELLMSLNLESMYDENKSSILIQCADKYAVRKYVEERGYRDILNECYGVFDSVDDIDFGCFPNQFVLKLTNGSGQNFICKDKGSLDLGDLRETLRGWMNEASSFGLKTGEWHYSRIKPRIIAEKYLDSLGGDDSIIDYKFQCYGGDILGILVCYDRDPITHRANYDWYDPDWSLTDGEPPRLHPHQRLIPRPHSFDQMCKIARDLSAGIDHVRIDLYDTDDGPLFGEMTFTEGGNIMEYNQWVLDAMYNKLIQLKDE